MVRQYANRPATHLSAARDMQARNAAVLGKDSRPLTEARFEGRIIQAKLVAARSDDALEREADSVAERVTSNREPARIGTMTAQAGGGTPAPAIVADALRTPGQPLDAATRADMGLRIGHDFSGVRVHADETAHAAASALGARAFTAGRDIVFAKAQFQPGSSAGRSLLAHELAHTVQQSGMLHLKPTDDSKTITVEKGMTLYAIAKKYGTTVEAIEALNGLKSSDIAIGQKLKIPVTSKAEPPKTPAPVAEPKADAAKAAIPATNDAGPETDSPTMQSDTATTAGKPGAVPAKPKRLLVTWSIDDGPRGAVTESMKKVGLGGVSQVIWFLQYSNIKTADWDKMRQIQKNGGEIGIHSFYKDMDHIPWFPKVKGPAYGAVHIDDDMATRMAQLKAFRDRLVAETIVPHFVRVPGGLLSELWNYGTQLGLGAKAKPAAEAIIAQTDISAFGPAAKTIAADFALLKKTLNDLNLLLWGSGDLSVDTDPKAIGTQEWTAETSGAGARDDDTTNVVDPHSKTQSAKHLKKGAGKFERLIATMQPGDVKGMVILAHDTYSGTAKQNGQNDITAVRDDRIRIETECARLGVTLEYKTMSGLFNEVTGKDIATYKAEY